MIEQTNPQVDSVTARVCLTGTLALLDRILNRCRSARERVIANRTARAYIRQLEPDDERACPAFGEAVSHLRRLLDGCATQEQLQHADASARDFLDLHLVDRIPSFK